MVVLYLLAAFFAALLLIAAAVLYALGLIVLGIWIIVQDVIEARRGG